MWSFINDVKWLGGGDVWRGKLNLIFNAMQEGGGLAIFQICMMSFKNRSLLIGCLFSVFVLASEIDDIPIALFGINKELWNNWILVANKFPVWQNPLNPNKKGEKTHKTLKMLSIKSAFPN